METNEAKIIKQCQEGDLEAFGILYDEYIKKIYDFVYYKTMHKETAEDIVSLVFTKALENIEKHDSNKGTFSSWRYRIALNRVIDHYRTQKKEKDIDDVWDLSGDTDVERDTDNKTELEKVEKYLKTLTSDQRDIIVMRLWQGMSHQEIAEVLGKNESAVKVAYSRAMKDLRKNVDVLIALVLLLSK